LPCTKGRTWVTEEGEVKCKGEKFDYEGKHYEDLVISHQLAITLVEDTALINPDETLITNQEEIILDCKVSENACATSQATYIWDTPTEQEKCLYFESRRTKGTVVTSETGDSTYMSTDGSMEEVKPDDDRKFDFMYGRSSVLEPFLWRCSLLTASKKVGLVSRVRINCSQGGLRVSQRRR
jgi:hypothetical protein